MEISPKPTFLSKRMKKFRLKLMLQWSDPVYRCNVYKEIGCCHVDGPLCDFPQCTMNIQYEQNPG